MAEAPSATSPTRPRKAVSVMLITFCARRLRKMGREMSQICRLVYMRFVRSGVGGNMKQACRLLRRQTCVLYSDRRVSYFTRRLVAVSGKMTVGLNRFASSKSIEA